MKLYKTDYTLAKYTELREYAEANGMYIDDKGDYYETVAIAEPTLDELKADKLLEINNSYTQEANLVKVGTPDDEVSTWDIQRLEAQAWQKNNEVETPFLTILSLQRGVDRVWLIEKVLEKVTSFEQYMASLTGKRQKLEDSIKAATTKEQLELIKWS